LAAEPLIRLTAKNIPNDSVMKVRGGHKLEYLLGFRGYVC
jgi:hypothetical protein